MGDKSTESVKGGNKDYIKILVPHAFTVAQSQAVPGEKITTRRVFLSLNTRFEVAGR